MPCPATLDCISDHNTIMFVQLGFFFFLQTSFHEVTFKELEGGHYAVKTVIRFISVHTE